MRARPQLVWPGRERRVVDARQQPVALALDRELLPSAGTRAADLDRPVGDARHGIRRLDGDERRVARDRRLERQLRRLGVVAQRTGTDAVCWDSLPAASRRVRTGSTRPAMEPERRNARGRPRPARPVAFPSTRRAELVGRRHDRRAIDLRRVRPGYGEVVAVAPRVSALDGDVDAIRRGPIDPRRNRRGIAGVASRIVARQHEGLRAFTSPSLCRRRPGRVRSDTAGTAKVVSAFANRHGRCARDRDSRRRTTSTDRTPTLSPPHSSTVGAVHPLAPRQRRVTSVVTVGAATSSSVTSARNVRISFTPADEQALLRRRRYTPRGARCASRPAPGSPSLGTARSAPGSFAAFLVGLHVEDRHRRRTGASPHICIE